MVTSLLLWLLLVLAANKGWMGPCILLVTEQYNLTMCSYFLGEKLLGEIEVENTSHGRGAARPISEWGTGTKIHIDFDEEWKPIKENARRFSTQLGVMARYGQKVPLTYTSWNEVPLDILDDIWNDVQENTDVPDAYRLHCLRVVGDRWKDWKCRLKKKWYDGFKTDAEHLAVTPPQVTTDQWKTLVCYWGVPDVKECSEVNKANRAQGNAPHRTGRISFAQVRHKNQFNQHLEEREEHEQDHEAFREEVFTKVMGQDEHGRVRMYGAGITPSQVFGRNLGCSNINENSMRDELEREFKSNYEAEIRDLQSKYKDVSAQVELVMAHIGLQNNPAESESEQQIRDVSSVDQRGHSVSNELNHN